jgi:HAD superfamily hydrolase (TIGR01509 family)
MDGTLIDSNEASEATWQKWAAVHQVPIESIRVVHHGRRPEETIAIVAPHLNALEEAKVIYDAQETSMQGIYPIAGANRFFESVPRGQSALVTAATRRIVGLRFEVVGLVPPEVCVTSETLNIGKPDPEGYLQAARRLGFRPEECIVFEDAPAGFIAAHRAGMQSVAILSNYSEAELRNELGPEVVPAAFLPNLLGVSYANGILTIRN